MRELTESNVTDAIKALRKVIIEDKDMGSDSKAMALGVVVIVEKLLSDIGAIATYHRHALVLSHKEQAKDQDHNDD